MEELDSCLQQTTWEGSKDLYDCFRSETATKYYKEVFPYELIVNWLSQLRSQDVEQSAALNFREIAFRMNSAFDTLIVRRYQSFVSAAELKKAVLNSQYYMHQLDVGAVYTLPPYKFSSIGENVQRVVAQRELVVDIDLNSYDDVRGCCQKGDVCTKCWKLIVAAQAVLEVAMREDFGFEQLLWVFSGRRGVHLWVSDRRAALLDNFSRESIFKYLSPDSHRISNEELVSTYMISNYTRPIFNSNSQPISRLDLGNLNWLLQELTATAVVNECSRNSGIFCIAGRIRLSETDSGNWSSAPSTREIPPNNFRYYNYFPKAQKDNPLLQKN